MARKLTITANACTFSARPGDILLDAALQQGVPLPHDCRAGQCGSCRVRLRQGQLLGGETAQSGVFHACQARVFSDAQLDYDRLPAASKTSGTLVRIDRLAPDIRGLTIALKMPGRHRPGQYYRVAFRGFPPRCFSPSPPFVGGDDRRTLRLHVKMVRDGAVSSSLETRIRPGHKLTVWGPFGSAFFRAGDGRRLVLVASGTGFAPIWAIARASLLRQPDVPLLLIAGARRLSSLYMIPALCRLAVCPAADFVVTADETQWLSEIVRRGTPDQHLPPLGPSDLVYAAGSPRVVETVCDAASRAGAEFYADPFTASGTSKSSWLLADAAKRRLEEWRRRWGARRSAWVARPEPMARRLEPTAAARRLAEVREGARDQV